LGPRIADKRVNQDGFHPGIGVAARQRKLHHLGPVALAEIVLLANPNIYGTQILFDLSPIMRFLLGWVYDLNDSNAAAIYLPNQKLAPIRVARQFGVPIRGTVIAGGGDNVRLSVPISKEREVYWDGRSKSHIAPSLWRWTRTLNGAGRRLA
jgi:hypothetical protein